MQHGPAGAWQHTAMAAWHSSSTQPQAVEGEGDRTVPVATSAHALRVALSVAARARRALSRATLFRHRQLPHPRSL
eukprot:2511641-Rhodomonas_salina.1